MPFIDPSLILLDPQFTDQFSLVQRVQTISTFGEVSTTNTTVPNVVGVITPSKPADLRRVDDSQRGARTITIFTRTRVNGPAQVRGTQMQPDQVLWSGDLFVVVEVLPWTQYGAGWVKVIATSVDSVEATL